jgi:hypothetical protein
MRVDLAVEVSFSRFLQGYLTQPHCFLEKKMNIAGIILALFTDFSA